VYHPYLRGKQYELVMLRENAGLLAEARIHPIIEPVRNDLSAIRRALDVLAGVGVECTLVINPRVGELRGQTNRILAELFEDRPDSWSVVDAGYIMHADSDPAELVMRAEGRLEVGFALIHGGYSDGRGLAAVSAGLPNLSRHVFLDGLAGKLYTRHFADSGVPRVLVRDGFKQQAKNAAYPQSDHFSDLHITFADEGMNGFGDYLTVGAGYSESGGPAYAVAVHVTYTDDESDMQTFHFVSDQTDSPTDPGGKFLEALAKLVAEAERPGTRLLRTSACAEFVDLYDRGDYRGLGYAKKLSMQHHMELMAALLADRAGR
jgi:hypothetical protein